MSLRSLQSSEAAVGDNKARLALFDTFTARQMVQLSECVEACGGTDDSASGGLKDAVLRLLDADNKPFVKMFDMLLAKFRMVGDPAEKDALFASVSEEKKRKAAAEADAGYPHPAAKKAVTPEKTVTIKQEDKKEADKDGDANELSNDRFTLSVFQSTKKLMGAQHMAPAELDVVLKAKPKEGVETKVFVVGAFDQSSSMTGERTKMAAAAMKQLPDRLRSSIKEGDLVKIFLGFTMWGSDEHFYQLCEPFQVSGSGVDHEAIDEKVEHAVARLKRSNGQCGLTNISKGMEHAAEYLAAHNPSGDDGFDMTHIIVITDGDANRGETDCYGIRTFAAKIRREYRVDGVHTLPLTAGQSTEFCRAMAEGGHGLAAFAPTEKELPEAIVEICMPLARARGFFIVNEEFKGWLTPTRDYAATKITVPVGAIGTTFSYVMRVQMLRKREPFVVKIDVEFVAEDDVPKEDVPTELKDALDRESAWKELTEKMAAAEQTYKGDVRKMLQHVRSVKKDMTRRGYSANATSDVTRMATQFEKQESEPAYRSMSAEAQHHHTQSVMRSLGAS